MSYICQEIACTEIRNKERDSIENFVPSTERNDIFQKVYQETTRCQSSKVHGNGYMARYPSRRKLMLEQSEEHARSETAAHKEKEELKAQLEKVQEQLQSQVAQMEAEKEEHKRCWNNKSKRWKHYRKLGRLTKNSLGKSFKH
jgi:DNA repair exonuclease SbcCD ATPase subunit